jgi:hypothetical protein
MPHRLKGAEAGHAGSAAAGHGTRGRWRAALPCLSSSRSRAAAAGACGVIPRLLLLRGRVILVLPASHTALKGGAAEAQQVQQ